MTDPPSPLCSIGAGPSCGEVTPRGRPLCWWCRQQPGANSRQVSTALARGCFFTERPSPLHAMPIITRSSRLALPIDRSKYRRHVCTSSMRRTTCSPAVATARNRVARPGPRMEPPCSAWLAGRMVPLRALIHPRVQAITLNRRMRRRWAADSADMARYVPALSLGVKCTCRQALSTDCHSRLRVHLLAAYPLQLLSNPYASISLPPPDNVAAASQCCLASRSMHPTRSCAMLGTPNARWLTRPLPVP